MRKTINLLIILSLSSLLSGQVNPGQIGSNQVICYGSAPSRLTFTVLPSGGTTPYTYRWQRSNDNGTNWTDITGTSATLNYYSPPVLGRTAMFRCRVTDALAVSGLTNSVTIGVGAELTAGTIGNAQTVYASTIPAPLSTTGGGASGGTGTYSYQWQRSSDGLTWSDIQGANSESYTSLALSTDTWFRRFVIDGLCGSTSSNQVRITVNPITLFTSELPDGGGADYFNLGTEFEVLADGFITKARLYTNSMEVGEHLVRLWRKVSDGVYVNIAGPYSWEFTNSYTGWREFQLPSPVQVNAGTTYILSITSAYNNDQYVQSAENFTPAVSNIYLRYIRGVYNAQINDVPRFTYLNTHYFRDVVFILFSPGSISGNQTICYNTAPASISQVTPPSGGTGQYTFQWQSSPDNSTWNNISGATSASFSPGALTTSTYFRRNVTSGEITSNSQATLITVNPEFSLAQLHDNITIFNNTATNISIGITGGSAPYTINYQRNGIPQPPLTGYIPGTGITTGVLSAGEYVYGLTSVTDATGCTALSLGTPITVSVTGTYSPTVTNKGLVLVNSLSSDYIDFVNLVKPYLDHFGVPYDIYNSSSPSGHPAFTNYSVIIFGHSNVYSGISPNEYPVSDLYAAISSGVGLVSFDPALFNYTTGTLSNSVATTTVSDNNISIGNTTHYITSHHQSDPFNIPINQAGDLYSNNYDLLTLRTPLSVTQTSTLISGATLATLTDGVNTNGLLEISSYGNGRIVKWNSYDWVDESILGPIYGMDDLIWRGIVWSARKPFVMQGLPPMITMRVDDVDGYGEGIGVMVNFEWINICNEYGLIPWCGTFNMTPERVAIFKQILDRDGATASPHAFSYESFIYFNHDGLPSFDPAENTRAASAFYTSNGLKMSNFMLPHQYEIDPAALPEIHNMGIEFIGTHMAFGTRYGSFWFDLGPYRIPDAYTFRSSDIFPVFYADDIDGGGHTFTICLTEIRDDSGYEWLIREKTTPDIIAQAVRQLTRSLNSMALPTLFTHQDQLEPTPALWRTILSSVTSNIASFNPVYTSMDYAVKYIRAKNNILLTNVSDEGSLVNITFSGVNDMDTQCYLFTESANVISQRLIALPQISSGTITVGVNE